MLGLAKVEMEVEDHVKSWLLGTEAWRRKVTTNIRAGKERPASPARGEPGGPR